MKKQAEGFACFDWRRCSKSKYLKSQKNIDQNRLKSHKSMAKKVLKNHKNRVRKGLKSHEIFPKIRLKSHFLEEYLCCTEK